MKNNEYKFCFLSNNSTKTITQYLEKFQKFNLEVNPEQVITSSKVTLHYLATKIKGDSINTVFVIGEKGLKEELSQEGYTVVEKKKNNIDAVVVGMDRSFTYEKLSIGLQACLNGARFIGTNPDPQFPTSDGFFPGAGSMIGALKAALNKEPEIICGKPHPLMAHIMLDRFDLNSDETVMIGDRVSTDLTCADNSNIHPVLILTGFGKEEYRLYPKFPYYATINSLFELFE